MLGNRFLALIASIAVVSSQSSTGNATLDSHRNSTGLNSTSTTASWQTVIKDARQTASLPISIVYVTRTSTVIATEYRQVEQCVCTQAGQAGFAPGSNQGGSQAGSGSGQSGTGSSQPGSPNSGTGFTLPTGAVIVSQQTVNGVTVIKYTITQSKPDFLTTTLYTTVTSTAYSPFGPGQEIVKTLTAVETVAITKTITATITTTAGQKSIVTGSDVSASTWSGYSNSSVTSTSALASSVSSVLSDGGASLGAGQRSRTDTTMESEGTPSTTFLPSQSAIATEAASSLASSSDAGSSASVFDSTSALISTTSTTPADESVSSTISILPTSTLSLTSSEPVFPSSTISSLSSSGSLIASIPEAEASSSTDAYLSFSATTTAAAKSSSPKQEFSPSTSSTSDDGLLMSSTSSSFTQAASETSVSSSATGLILSSTSSSSSEMMTAMVSSTTSTGRMAFSSSSSSSMQSSSTAQTTTASSSSRRVPNPTPLVARDIALANAPGKYTNPAYIAPAPNGDLYMVSNVYDLLYVQYNGDGSYATPVLLFSYPSYYGTFSSLYYADFNGDGISDLVYGYVTQSSSTRGLYVMLGQSASSFAAPFRVPPQSVDFYGAGPQLGIGDLNLDGTLDIGVAGAQQQLTNTPTVVPYVELYNNDGPASFYPQDVSTAYSPSYAGSAGITFVDLDGDGLLDIVSTNQNANSISIVKNLGNSLYDSPNVIRSITTGPRFVTSGDVNGDGYVDIVYLTDSSMEVLFQTAPGVYGARYNYSLPRQSIYNGPTLQSAVVVDLNGDGINDIAVVAAQGPREGLNVWLGRSDMTFAPPLYVNFTAAGTLARSDSNPNYAFVFDFDGDGYPDIGVIDTASYVRVAYNRFAY